MSTPTVIDPAPDAELLAALRRYWGYDGFLPQQERIVRSLLGGKDACVILPTGGGKSLCYQLPAALQSQHTVVVISPLIALMQDQVAQLSQMGIPSALLNSSLTASEQSQIMRKARGAEYRLLYLSPERLARADTIDWLQRVPVSFFAIDEAHCISEWGHDFRPEYRQLSRLRASFPDCPIAAFTASATRRVRHDIIEQLQLQDPHKCIASFHRPNLRYIVRESTSRSQPGLLMSALRQHAGSNIIIYAPTIARVEETVDFLGERRIAAIAYHGKMDADARRRNQERWMSDEVRVLVGTVAFGLGINKTTVRAVVHLSMPKSIEQYYQEAGRAGRDGNPADCILLWQKRDTGLLAHFIEQVTDPDEKERSWQRYHGIRAFVESRHCRHKQICRHFGENPKWDSCGACDFCGAEPDWLHDGEERKLQEKDRSKHPSAAVAARAGRPERPQTSALTAADPDLLEYLREWRRETAKQKNIPAYVVLHDTSLDEICRAKPALPSQLLTIYGIGVKKAELYGREILDALARFRAGARAAQPEAKKSAPAEETLQLLAEGRSFEEIARIRDRQPATVVGMVAGLVEKGKAEFQPAWVDLEKRVSIEAACARLGTERLRPLREALPPEITAEEIRLVVARLRWQQLQQA